MPATIGAVHEACPPHSSAGIVANMTASTVAQYLAALPAERRAALSAVRRSVTGVSGPNFVCKKLLSLQ